MNGTNGGTRSGKAKRVGDAVVFENGYGARVPGVVEAVERRTIRGPQGGVKRTWVYQVRVPASPRHIAQGYAPTALFEVFASSLVKGVA